MTGAALEAEIRAWYERYDAAWNARDAEAIVDMIDPALSGMMVMMDGTTFWEVAAASDNEGTRSFLAYAAEHAVETDTATLDVAFRSPDEAIVLRRKTIRVPDGPDRREVTMFSVETLRRDAAGQWRQIRYWAEKARIG